jgi:hypothetical protein
MPTYRVQINGNGIRLPAQSAGQDIVGFFTTRVVRATSEEQAFRDAKELVLKQWISGAYAEANKGSRPEITLEWVKRTNFLDLLFFRGTGYCFYSGEEPN